MSTVQLRVAGVGSVFPAASVARTSKTCAPSESSVYVAGEEQPAKVPAPSRHSNVEPVSLEVKLKAAEVEFVGSAGAEPIVVFGAVVSTVHVSVAGEASALPAWSTARTWKV